MAKKESTLRCVATLTIIAVVCAFLLSTLNFLLYVAPTVDALDGVYPALEGYNWEKTDTADGSYGSGGKVTLAAVGKKDGGADYLGIIVTTDKSGKLNQSEYAMYFNLSTDTLEYAAFITEGATGGFNWQYAESHGTGGGGATTGATALTGLLSGNDNAASEAELKVWNSFLNVKITSENVLDFTGNIPKTGATFTVTATYSAFNIAARYYYENYVKGGDGQ